MNYIEATEAEATEAIVKICKERGIESPESMDIDGLLRWLAIQNGGVEVVFHLLDDGECYEIVVEIHNTSTDTYKYYSIDNFNTYAGSTEAYQMLLIHIVELINGNILLKEEK